MRSPLETSSFKELISDQLLAVMPKNIIFYDRVTLNHIDTTFPINIRPAMSLWNCLFTLGGDFKQQKAYFIFKSQSIGRNPYQNKELEDILIESSSVLLGNILSTFFLNYHFKSSFNYPKISPYLALNKFKTIFKSEYNITIDQESDLLDVIFLEKQ